MFTDFKLCNSFGSVFFYLIKSNWSVAIKGIFFDDTELKEESLYIFIIPSFFYFKLPDEDLDNESDRADLDEYNTCSLELQPESVHVKEEERQVEERLVIKRILSVSEEKEEEWPDQKRPRKPKQPPATAAASKENVA